MLVASIFFFLYNVFRPFENGFKFAILNPFPNDKSLDSFNFEEFADDNFKFDEHLRRFSKRVENTVGKGEIACHEQFLLIPQCFQKTLLQTRKNQGLFGKGLTHSHTMTPFDAPGKQAF